MVRPLDRGTKVKILVGSRKGQTGTYKYHCCRGFVIDITGGGSILLHRRSDFSVVTKRKAKV